MTSTLDRIERRLPGPMIIAGVWLAAGAALSELRAAATILAMAAPMMWIAGQDRRRAAVVLGMGAAGALLAGVIPA